MILYTERQLEDAYLEYRKYHMRKDIAFITLDEFRILYEKIMSLMYEEVI